MRKDSIKKGPATLQKFGQMLGYNAKVYTVVGEDKVRITNFGWDPNSSTFQPLGPSSFMSTLSARKVWRSWAKRGYCKVSPTVVERWAQDIFA